MNREKLINLFYTWIVPPILASGIFFFIQIIGWLANGWLANFKIMQHTDSGYEVALAIWGLSFLALCASALVFSNAKRKGDLRSFYKAALFVVSGLFLLAVMFLGAASGASPALESNK
jgi:hypothetical protein